MRIIIPDWMSGNHTCRYSGLVQSRADTCVFASIASAVNWLTGSELREQELLHAWTLDNTPATFGIVKYVHQRVQGLVSIEYHDRDNPRPESCDLLAEIKNGAVLIASLEFAGLRGDRWSRASSWHMISLFGVSCAGVHAWDTCGRSALLEIDAVRDLLCSDSPVAIAYPPSGHLIAHDQHNCLLLKRATAPLEAPQ